MKFPSRAAAQSARFGCGLCGRSAPVALDLEALAKTLDANGKILPARRTGYCAEHQRQVALACKRARELGLLPR